MGVKRMLLRCPILVIPVLERIELRNQRWVVGKNIVVNQKWRGITAIAVHFAIHQSARYVVDRTIDLAVTVRTLHKQVARPGDPSLTQRCELRQIKAEAGIGKRGRHLRWQQGRLCRDRPLHHQRCEFDVGPDPSAGTQTRTRPGFRDDLVFAWVFEISECFEPPGRTEIKVVLKIRRGKISDHRSNRVFQLETIHDGVIDPGISLGDARRLITVLSIDIHITELTPSRLVFDIESNTRPGLDDFDVIETIAGVVNKRKGVPGSGCVARAGGLKLTIDEVNISGRILRGEGTGQDFKALRLLVEGDVEVFDTDEITGRVLKASNMIQRIANLEVAESTTVDLAIGRRMEVGMPPREAFMMRLGQLDDVLGAFCLEIGE